MNFTSKTQEFLGAVCFLTRIPVPRLDPFPDFKRCLWAFPLVGAILGANLGLVYWAFSSLIAPLPAAFLALGLGVMLTGGLHEDGLADTADGLWGGHTKERRLEIMRDSRIGSYGVLALIFFVGLNCALLAEISGPHSIAVLAAIGALSRGVLPLMLQISPPARSDGIAASLGGQQSWSDTAPALVITSIIIMLCIGHLALPLIAAALGVTYTLHKVALAKIGGITGDILGALATICHIFGLILLTLLQ